jgi:hypothetical protein
VQPWKDGLSASWKGNGPEALHARAYADKAKVSGLVDQLREAAKVARAGASNLYAARSHMRYAVEDAREAGFNNRIVKLAVGWPGSRAWGGTAAAAFGAGPIRRA